MAKMAVIASFADRGEAEDAAYFLQRHGINAFTGSAYHGENRSISVHRRGMDCPLFVSEKDWAEAEQLLRKVAAGGFDHADPEKDSREGLGANLARSLAPSPGYRKPKAWLLWAPMVALPAIWLLGVIVSALTGSGR